MLSLYIHTPYCLSRCSYCDFVSGFEPSDDTLRRYRELLCRELALFQDVYFVTEPIKTLYFGGGTPSLFNPIDLECLLQTIKVLFPTDFCETTLEANPEDVNRDLVLAWKGLGIDRISLGFQSMEESILRRLNRRNSPLSNRLAFDTLRWVGFENISLDIILSLSGSLSSLKEMLALSPEHLSAYNLTISPQTELYRQVLDKTFIPLNDDEVITEYETASKILSEKGYSRYEVSNFSKGNGFISKHNQNYWNYGEYIGIGCGASGFIRTPKGMLRYHNHSTPHEYEKSILSGQLPIAESEISDTQTAMRDFIMLGLRKSEGVLYCDFERVFGFSLTSVFPRGYENKLLSLAEFLVLDSLGIRLTFRGVSVMNSIVLELWNLLG